MTRANDKKLDARSEALALALARPAIMEMFLGLTEHGQLEVSWDPTLDVPQWEGAVEPTEADFKRIAASRVLFTRGMVSQVQDAGGGKHMLCASGQAMAVRQAYDALPAELVLESRRQFTQV